MLKINPLSTLYVGIDVSSKSNYVCALDFYKNKYINSSFANNQPGAEELLLWSLPLFTAFTSQTFSLPARN